ncbi:MAG: FtsX-like permease family protein, partial [Vicinamibacterales bacterium]
AAVWVPLAFEPGQRNSPMHWRTVRGRLREGTSVQQAMAQLAAADRAISPPALVSQPGRTIEVRRLDEWLVGSRLRRTVIVAFGAALLVLLIACANVANLLLARGATRRRELAVRAALGAGRARLVAQLLTESVVLCALGGGAGLALAYGLLGAAGPLVREALPPTADVRLDLRVLAFTGATVVAVALGVGILPALQTRFGALAGWLNQGARGSSGRQARVRRLIVVGEVALSLVLVCGAGLLLRSLLRLQAVESGIRIAGVVAIDASLPENLYPSADAAARAFAAIAERVEAAPGVRRAAFTSHLPLRWIGNGEGMQVGSGEMFGVRFKRVDPGYFDAFDIPVVAGRGVTRRDTPGARRVVVLNEPLAARVAEQAGVADPIGQVVRLTFPAYGKPESDAGAFEVVGVIRPERVDAPGRPDPPVAYVAMAQVPTAAATLIVRVDGDAATAIGGVREAVREVAPGLPLGEVTTMTEVREGTFAGTTRPAWIIGAFAAVATLLAALGLYGVLAHMVAARRREIGIRMALGAGRGEVVSGILGGAAALLLGGMAAGLVGAVAFTRVLAGLLFDVSPLDPVALAAACAATLAVGLLAAYLPASRAAGVDPVAVLREEG